MDCTPKCRFAKHAELILSAITKEAASTVCALLPRVCKNYARVEDQFGRNALHLAASCGKVDVLEWLVKENGVDLDSKDAESGWTSLHRSLFYGHLNCAVKLLQFGSNLSCFDNEGLTPLDLVRLDSPFQVTTGVEAQVLALYETCLEDELSLQIGDVIDNIRMTDKAYWTGELDGRRGLFPKSCVELLSKDHNLELLTWGANTNFTLGHRDESTRHVPEMVDSVEGGGKIYIKEVVMCKFHSVFLSVDGRVFTCGHGRGGRLGHGDEKTVLALREVAALQGTKSVVIAAGQDHTVVVTNDGTVFTFGLNDSHQLGHSPPPTQCLLPRQVQLKVWKTKCIVGAVAGRYHSVFFTRNEVYTCGLNAGQLGHSRGEKYQILPRQVSCLAHKDIKIRVVACSDGATVCTTDKGDVFLLNQYICRKIVTRFLELTRLTVVGGQLDLVSSQDVGKKFADELTITLLNSKGEISQWKPQFGSVQQCRWSYSRPITVRDFAVGRQLLIVSDDGEAFICYPRSTQSSPGKSESGSKDARSPSISSCLTEVQLAQSSPASPPVGHIIKCDAPAQSEPSTTPLSRLVEGRIRKDTVDFLLERISLIHRGKRIFTDSKCRGFAVLQVSSKEGLKERPNVGPGQIWYHFSQLLEEASCEDNIHDVEFLVNGKAIPAHSFIVASRSPACHQLFVENKGNWPGKKKLEIRKIQLEETLDQGAVKQWLKRLYCGEKVNDKEIFFRSIAVSNKNGYQVVQTSKGQKHLPKSYTDKLAKDGAKVNEVYNGQITIDPTLQALVCLSRNDLDYFTTPVLENDILAEEANVKQSESPNATPHIVRERGKASPSCVSRKKSFKFSRLNSPELCDVVIVTEGGVEFACHKCVLIARLEYFRSMLACGWLEASMERKTLTLAVPPNVLEIVLDFLYSGQAPRLEDQTDLELLGNVLVVADQLLIARLKEICEEVIANLITLKNAAELLEFALLYNANQLQNVCTEFVCHNLASLLEARSLDVLSDKGLLEISKVYQESIPGMAWRMISPLNLHSSIVLETNEANWSKRKKSAARKKSSKSESELEALIETEKEKEEVQRGHRDDDDVFQAQQMRVNECEKIVKGKLGDIKEKETPRGANGTDSREQQAISSQLTHDLGRWYRKHSPEGASHKRNKSTRMCLEAKASVEYPSEIEEASEKAANVAKKVSSPTEPPWSCISVCKPPATNFKAIIEQEESQAVRADDLATQKLSSSSKPTPKNLSPNQRSSTDPQTSAVHWNSSSRQKSQKQRKRSKSNTQEDVSDARKVSEAKTTLKQVTKQEEKRPTAWGGVYKKPVPVMSLRDLMQEEELANNARSGESAESVLSPSASFKKSGCARKKLDWRPQWDFHGTFSAVEPKEISDQHEHAESVSSFPPKRAWQSNDVPGSPPSPTVTFSEIVESQQEENTNLDKVRRKPFHLTQLEEEAMEELFEHYGGQYNPCELISVQRIPATEARPRWREERSPSIASG